MPSATRLMLERDVRGPWRSRPRASFRLGYRPALDGLRGLAVAAIIGFNLGVPGFGGGHVGIDVFFVLSGFLITSLLIEEWERQGRVDLTSFYIRRALRILPPLFLVLVVCLGGAFLFSGAYETKALIRGTVATLLYAGNLALAQGQDTGALGHTWTIAIQEQFYLVWPPIFAWLLARNASRGRIAIALLVACVGVAVARYAVFSHVGWQHAYYDLETRADGLLMGCVVACLSGAGLLPTRGRRLLALRVLGLVSLAGLVAVPLASGDHYRLLYLGFYTAIEVAAATFIASIVATPVSVLQRLLSWSPLVWLGRISFPLYLWHFPVSAVIGGANNTLESWASVVGVSIVLALATHLFLERPLEAVRAHLRRIPGQRSSSTQTLVLALPPPRPAPAIPEPPRLAGVRPWIHEPFQVPAPHNPASLPTPAPSARNNNTIARIEAFQG